MASSQSSDDLQREYDSWMKLCAENAQKAREDQSGRVYRVYADGVFDMFHLGHMRVLEQAKKALGDPKKVHLIVGVCTDEDVHKYKGKTVMDHKLRVDTVAHCKWVDEVVADAPWIITQQFIDKYNIDFVAHDAIPYVSAGCEDVYAFVKKQGKFLETQRTEGISTSDLIVQIVRDYDDYVRRNLARGYTKKDLNVGSTWFIRSQKHEKDKRLREQIKAMKGEWQSTERAVFNFMKTFDPRFVSLRRSASGFSSDEEGNTHKEEESKERNLSSPSSSSASSPLAPPDDSFIGYCMDYFSYLREQLPVTQRELLYHSYGLAKASVKTGIQLLSYLNLCSYCRGHKEKPQ